MDSLAVPEPLVVEVLVDCEVVSVDDVEPETDVTVLVRVG